MRHPLVLRVPGFGRTREAFLRIFLRFIPSAVALRCIGFCVPRSRLDEVEGLMNIITAPGRSVTPLLFGLFGLSLGFGFDCLWDNVGIPAGMLHVEKMFVSPE